MNRITKNIVIETAKRNPRAARDNGDEFYYLVKKAWWDEIVDLMGAELKGGMERAFVEIFPRMASDEGFLKARFYGTEIEMDLDRLVMLLIDLIVGELGEWIGFDTEWGDLPEIIGNVIEETIEMMKAKKRKTIETPIEQMKMFE